MVGELEADIDDSRWAGVVVNLVAVEAVEIELIELNACCSSPSKMVSPLGEDGGSGSRVALTQILTAVGNRRGIDDNGGSAAWFFTFQVFNFVLPETSYGIFSGSVDLGLNVSRSKFKIVHLNVDL